MTEGAPEIRSAPAPDRRWLVLGPLAVAFWRIAYPSPVGLWRDWILILSLYGIYGCLASRTRAPSVIPLAIMAYLLGVYIQGQLPYALAALRLLP